MRTVDTVTSRDGTAIAYETGGDGPALILVDGALSTSRNESKPELVASLAPRFTVYNYDRRGRGGSGDTQPYAVAREVEDIDALIEHAGGKAFLFGHSSGGCLALGAAGALGDKVAGVAVYEAPWNDDLAIRKAWGEYLRDLGEALADGRRGDAVALFMRYLGTPPEQIAAMREAPFWPSFEAIAPTLAYDHSEIMGPTMAVPKDELAGVEAPVLAVCGDASPAFMCATAHTIAQTVRHGEFRALEGQTHAVPPKVIAPVLIGFFSGDARSVEAA
jgi:pimeloyl-ACP methyl ester carboxylesterase